MLKVIAQAHEIPEGATVTKVKGGSVPYKLTRSVVFYDHTNANGARRVVHAEDGTVFLCDGGGVVNTYAGTREFVWHVDSLDLREFKRMIGEG